MSASDRAEEINVLKLTLHGRLVGYLAGYRGGRNVLSFAEEFRDDPDRPTFSLITHPQFPNANEVMKEPWAKRLKLHPTLSNLLPEGALRELIAQSLKVHVDNEFPFLSCLGRDLPGALLAVPMEPEDVPESVLSTHGRVKAVKFAGVNSENRFSLAGIQMKFSLKERDGRYNLTPSGELGDWIIKTPSTRHPFVPLNEFTAMSLAAASGVEIPEIKLVELGKLDNLPPINLPNEKLAFAIRRYDRDGNRRIHAEDFAQVLVQYPHNKYSSGNYENIGKIVYEYSGDGLADAQQLARRLLVNILLANGDAHLKNWSLLYPDQITPRLSPAYDIVVTSVFINGETKFALNLGKTKDWYTVTMAHFQSWADKAGIPWRAIQPHLNDTMEKARSLWPEALKNLPMHDAQKEKLRQHWSKLRDDFKIDSKK
jgi:serine/threonine-protein kinase HipA